MPKKATPLDPNAPEVQAILERFSRLGLSSGRCKTLIQSSKDTEGVIRLLDEQGLVQQVPVGGSNEPAETLAGPKFDEKQASLVVDLSKELGYDVEAGKAASASSSSAAKEAKVNPEGVAYILSRIGKGDLKSVDQIKGAIAYLTQNPIAETSSNIDAAAFDKASGVGYTYTLESLVSDVSSYLSSLTSVNSETAPKDWSALPAFRKQLTNPNALPDLKWANGRDLQQAVEKAFEALFGPKTSAKEDAKAKAKATAAKAKADAGPTAAAVGPADVNPTAAPNPTSLFTEGFLSKLHKPGENPQTSEERKRKHLEETGGCVMTRFPPEPNGYLHIGHAKAITIDFGYAKHHNGKCYLRFDDTNPDSEEGVYFDSILEMVRWLGFEPWKITYSSDNFDKLYDIAMRLTEKGLAFVCRCDQEAMAALKGGGRGNPSPCPHRDQSIEENVREFQAMKDGKYPEKGACLRLKIDLTSGNPYLWDPVAYRVKTTPHHRTGDKWKIYPTYDFTHPLCDSFENITHSLCTLEFVDARASYEWLCDAAEVYKPRQYETARLSLQGTFLSKRKIKKLVEEGHVTAWDDPRLFTLIALRRRGIPPAAMLRFVEELGVSLTNSETRLDRFENVIRNTLELSVARLPLVLDPVKLTIKNVPDDWQVEMERPFHPKVAEMGSYKTRVTKNVFIERDDFRVVPPADFIRLSPGKSVILMGAPFPITCIDHKEVDGVVTEVICALEDGSGPNGDKKFKSKEAPAIHWVSQTDAIAVDEVRYFEPLFKSENPAKVDDFVSDINPDSMKIHKGAVVDPAFFQLSQKLITEAKAAAEKRTKEAAAFSAGKVETGEAHLTHATTKNVPHGSDDTPIATADQLVGMECIRFQGMRLAYFCVDREAKIGCLEDGGTAGKTDGDKIIINRIVTLKEEKAKKAL